MSNKLYELGQIVREEVRERYENETDKAAWLKDPDYSGALHEIVDGSVPIYTYDLMTMATERLQLATDEPDLGPAFDGSPTPVNIIAANIYEHLSEIAWEEIEVLKGEKEV